MTDEKLDIFFDELNKMYSKKDSNKKDKPKKHISKTNIGEINTIIDTFNDSPFYREPTFLEITKYPHLEIVYSNILAFYFNIKKEHHLGDLVLQAFLKCANIKLDNIEQINVITEYCTYNGNRIDILLYNDDIVIGIENKVNAVVNNDLLDYAQTVEALNNNSYKIILSLKDEAEIANKNGYINVTYTDFINNIEVLTKDKLDMNNKWHIFLLEFIETIKHMKGEI